MAEAERERERERESARGAGSGGQEGGSHVYAHAQPPSPRRLRPSQPDVAILFQYSRSLRDLDLRMNPINKIKKYRDKMIIDAPTRLKKLDDKEACHPLPVPHRRASPPLAPLSRCGGSHSPRSRLGFLLARLPLVWSEARHGLPRV